MRTWSPSIEMRMVASMQTVTDMMSISFGNISVTTIMDRNLGPR
jgi:hypothetical protein